MVWGREKCNLPLHCILTGSTVEGVLSGCVRQDTPSHSTAPGGFLLSLEGSVSQTQHMN